MQVSFLLGDLQSMMMEASCGEEAEERVQDDTLDGDHGVEDFASTLGRRRSGERRIQNTLTSGRRSRRREAKWRKLSAEERIGIRRFRKMTGHATRPQMVRMLRYAGGRSEVLQM